MNILFSIIQKNNKRDQVRSLPLNSEFLYRKSTARPEDPTKERNKVIQHQLDIVVRILYFFEFSRPLRVSVTNRKKKLTQTGFIIVMSYNRYSTSLMIVRSKRLQSSGRNQKTVRKSENIRRSEKNQKKIQISETFPIFRRSGGLLITLHKPLKADFY